MSKLAIYPRIVRSDAEELGPGRRLGIWVQGCRKRCPGCTSPGLLKFQEPNETIDSLVERLLKVEDWTGLTISGGEPFEQAVGLAQLIQKLRLHKPELDVLVYSGFDYGELVQWPQAKALLSVIDGLVDGEYINTLHRNFLWFGGSENQTFRSLSFRSRPWAGQAHSICDEINNRYEDVVYQLIRTYEFGAPSMRIIRNTDWWENAPSSMCEEVERLLVRLNVCTQSGSYVGIPPKNFRQNFRNALRDNQIVLTSH